MRTLLRRLARFKKFRDKRAPQALMTNERLLIAQVLKDLEADELLQVVERFGDYYKRYVGES